MNKCIKVLISKNKKNRKFRSKRKQRSLPMAVLRKRPNEQKALSLIVLQKTHLSITKEYNSKNSKQPKRAPLRKREKRMRQLTGLNKKQRD